MRFSDVSKIKSNQSCFCLTGQKEGCQDNHNSQGPPVVSYLLSHHMLLPHLLVAKNCAFASAPSKLLRLVFPSCKALTIEGMQIQIQILACSAKG